MRLHRYTAPALFAVFTAVGAALALCFAPYTVDDAFISWRYGANLVDSGVWNWNPSASAVRVEAYTNPLYTGLSVIPALLGIPVELFFKVVSAAILVGYVVAVARLDVPRRQRLALCAFALLSPVFFVHLFSGLETVSFALLTAAPFALLSRHGRLTRWGQLAALGLALSRPEGIALAAVAHAWGLAVGRRRRDLWLALAAGGALAAYWLLRAWYFGRFFPNTFYQKSTGHGGWIDSALAAGPLVWAPAGAAVLAVAALGGRWLLRADRERLRDATPLVLAVCAAGIHLGLYQASVLAMNYADRFSWQILFPVAVVALVRPLTPRTVPWSTAASALAAATALSFEWHPALAAVAALVLTAVLWGGDRLRTPAALGLAAVAVILVSVTPPRELTAIAAYRYRLEYAHEALGRAVADDKGFRGTVAIGDAGIMPFCLGARHDVYDLRGLADPYLGRGLLPKRLADRDVQMVVAVGRPYDPKGLRATTPTSLPLVKRAYAQGFVPAGRMQFTDTAWQSVLVRPGVPAPGLKRAARLARRENLRPDAAVVRDHWGELPFLKQC
ncbi:hypothetical protein AB0J38_26515 [Streptomyces sp. NPDC050095]|uniref:hypothetical protein n=1 Tax=unclassified Streptomyces TaxID=2593676 RepID=UPI0034315E4F